MRAGWGGKRAVLPEWRAGLESHGDRPPISRSHRQRGLELQFGVKADEAAMIVRLLAASMILGALSSAALAADLPNIKGPPAFAPPPPPAFTWTGFYIGANVGYDWAYDQVTDVDAWDYYDGAIGPGVHPNGVTGGGQIGYNWQFTPLFVAGVEAEGGYISLHGSADFCSGAGQHCDPEQSINGGSLPDDYANVSGGAYGAVTGKLGFTLNRVLFYAKGGVAFGDFQVSFSSPFLVGGGASNQVNVGWTVGGGVEYALDPNWSIKAEYDFYDFGTTTNDAAWEVVPSEAVLFQHELTANKAVVGVNYRFDWFAPPASVVARY